MKVRIHGQAEIYLKDDEISRLGAPEACDEGGPKQRGLRRDGGGSPRRRAA